MAKSSINSILRYVFAGVVVLSFCRTWKYSTSDSATGVVFRDEGTTASISSSLMISSSGGDGTTAVSNSSKREQRESSAVTTVGFVVVAAAQKNETTKYGVSLSPPVAEASGGSSNSTAAVSEREGEEEEEEDTASPLAAVQAPADVAASSNNSSLAAVIGGSGQNTTDREVEANNAPAIDNDEFNPQTSTMEGNSSELSLLPRRKRRKNATAAGARRRRRRGESSKVSILPSGQSPFGNKMMMMRRRRKYYYLPWNSNSTGDDAEEYLSSFYGNNATNFNVSLLRFKLDEPRLYHGASKVLHPPPQTATPVVLSSSVDAADNTTTVTTYSASAACSCWNTTGECCERRVHMIHKMGFVLVLRLLRLVFGVNKRHYRHPPARHKKKFYKAHHRITYRSVIVARNLFDTLVSGYLYHKSGNECTKDRYGRVRPANESQVYYMTEVKWEDMLTYPAPHNKGGENRTICQYLADESEEDGMRVFMDFSMKYFYRPWVDYWRTTNTRQGTKFPFLRVVCYEKLSAPETQQEAFHELMEWLFPGGYVGPIDPDPPKRDREYAGLHATNADPRVKKRLRALAEKLDQELFNGTIASATEAFGCGLLGTSSNATNSSEGEAMMATS